MNTKRKLVYIAIGGLLVATGMIISPLNAQKDKFGDIECKSLKIGLGEDRYIHITGSFIWMWEKSPQKFGMISPGYASVGDVNGKTTIYSDAVVLDDAERYERVKIGIDKHGGYVTTKGRSKGYAIMGINEKGNGAMSTYDKNGYRQ